MVVVDIVCAGKLEEVSGTLTPMPISNILHAPLGPQDPPQHVIFLLFSTLASVWILPSTAHIFQSCP